MKKILLPILSAGAIASIATPMTLTSCGTTIYLDKFVDGESYGTDDELFLNSKPIKLSKGRSHIAKIDVSIMPSQIMIKENTDWQFMVITNFTTSPEYQIITEAQVWINGKELRQVPQPDDPYETLRADEFAIISADLNGLLGGKGILTRESKIKIKFKIKDDAENVSTVFTFHGSRV